MNTCELSVRIATLANAIAKGLDDEELVLMSAVFMQFGDTLSTISAQRSLCLARKSTDESKKITK